MPAKKQRTRVVLDTNVFVRNFKTRDNRSTVVRLGRRYVESRDPDDNVMLATAHAGKAECLLTNDRDLLDLPPAVRKNLPFAIMKPTEFLDNYEKPKIG